MDDHSDFDNVSWRNETDLDKPRSPQMSEPPHETTTSLPTRISDPTPRRSSLHPDQEPQAGVQAEAIDLAGIGDGVLECTVGSPLKENDGTKDAFVSYLVTTHVCLRLNIQMLRILDEESIFSPAAC